MSTDIFECETFKVTRFYDGITNEPRYQLTAKGGYKQYGGEILIAMLKDLIELIEEDTT